MDKRKETRMDSRMERDLEQVRYHEWILNEYRKLRNEDIEVPRESGNSNVDSTECDTGRSE